MRRGCRVLVGAGLVGVAWCAVDARGQSINIDFGPGSSAPSYLYSGVGRRGAWNAFESMPTNQRFALVNLYGQAIPARLYNNGSTALMTHHIDGIGAGDGALMDDMILSYNNPVDACIWVENLLAGTYQVIIYAMTPDDPARLCRTRVDFASPGPTMVGGAWPGAHAPGATYSSFTVSVGAGGTIGLHSGLYGGNFQSGINGFQIVRQGECEADWNGSGTVTIGDVFDYLNSWFHGTPTADFNGVNGITTQDVFDYLGAWFGPC